MPQAASSGPLTAETWIRARIIPCGVCGGQSGTEAWSKFFSEFFDFPLTVSFHRDSILMHHQGDKQSARWCPQFRDIVSPHRRKRHVVMTNDPHHKDALQLLPEDGVKRPELRLSGG
jgi:hypothetical protein